jgi:hypothetical protein
MTRRPWMLVVVQFENIYLVIPNPRQRARAFTSARVGVRDLVLANKIKRYHYLDAPKL